MKDRRRHVLDGSVQGPGSDVQFMPFSAVLLVLIVCFIVPSSKIKVFGGPTKRRRPSLWLDLFACGGLIRIAGVGNARYVSEEFVGDVSAIVVVAVPDNIA